MPEESGQSHARQDIIPQLEDHDEGIQLREYWRILVRRRWVLLGTLATVVAATMLFTFSCIPLYRATTTLQIERQGPEILTFRDVLGVDQAAYQDFYRTQYRIFQSRAVLNLTVEQLDLLNRPEYARRKGSPIHRLYRGTTAKLFGKSGTEDPLSQALRFIEEDLSISPVRKSHLVEISFTDKDPELARDVANAIAEAYQQFNFNTRYNTTAQAKEFLTKQVARLQGEIATLQRKLQEYSAENEIVVLSDGTQNISEHGLADLSTRVVEAKSRLAIAEARRKAANNSSAEDFAELLNSTLITHLEQEIAELERRHSRMAERFKPGWPRLIEVREELEQAQYQLALKTEGVSRHVRAAAQTDYERVISEVENLERLLQQQKAEVQRLKLQAIEYTGLKAEIEAKRQMLNDIASRQSETETSDRLKDTEASNVRVIDRAVTPKRPVSPKKLQNLLLGVLFGGSLGVGLALVLNSLDNTVKTEQDLQRISHLPVLGHLPLIQIRPAAQDGPNAYPVDLASHLRPQSDLAEAMRNLRTSLLLASPEHPPRSVMITSPEPEAGKSIVSINLAIVLSQLGRRVVLVDGDLRRPRIHTTLELSNEVGLSSFLSGNTGVAELIQETEIPRLNAITSGPTPPNPSELLNSPCLQALISTLQQDGRFDHVIFDSSPVLQVTDPVLLATRVDGTIIVVRAGSTRRDTVLQSATRLAQSRAPIIGVLLNAVSETTGSYYYSHYGYRHHHQDDKEQWKARRIARFRGRSSHEVLHSD